MTITATDAATRARVVAEYGKLPLSFEPNVAQVRDSGSRPTQFLSRGNGYTLVVAPNEAVLRLHRGARSSAMLRGRPFKLGARKAAGAAASGNAVVDLKLVGANVAPKVIGLDTLPGTVNYLRGHDPKKWHTAIPTYAKVKLEQVYPGIDLVYYGNQRQLEYDFIVAPGADPRAIRMSVSGLSVGKTARLTTPRIDRGGDLVLAAEGVRFHKPVVYQPGVDAKGVSTRTPVNGQYRLDRGQVAFQVAAYDHRKPLVIDPTLAYSTYINGMSDDEAYSSIAVDSSGNAYITAETDTTTLPTTAGAFQPIHAIGNDSDAFVLKINPTGTALVYATYLGGSGEDYGTAIAVDGAGEAIVLGGTSSADFPVTPGAFQTTLKALGASCCFATNLFVTKLNAAGSALIASTYVGGTVYEIPALVVLDHAGNVYVTGTSASPDFPVTPGVVQGTFKGSGINGGGDGVVVKLNPTLTALLYSTYLGGSGDEFMGGIAVDSSADVYVSGMSNSSDYPVTAGAFQTTFGGSGAFSFGDAVVTKLNPTATALLYSTYLGGSGDEFTGGIAIDKAGDAYVTGSTASNNFSVTPGAYQVVYGGAGLLVYGDVFVTKLNPQGSALIYSTYIGGDQDDYGVAIAVDGAGNAWVAGGTDSDDFPTTTNALQRHYAGPAISGAGTTFFSGDGFVLKLNAKGTALAYSTYLGGNGDDSFVSVLLHKGALYISGATTSTDFPTTPGAFNATCAGPDCGATQSFISKIQLP